MNHMLATLLFSKKQDHGDGFVELVIWRLPRPTPDRPHGLKYRLVYVVDGRRVVGYDNETGKGDHKHLGARELPYRFVDVSTLIADFLKDVEACDE